MFLRLCTSVSLIAAVLYAPHSNAVTVRDISAGYDNASQALIANTVIDSDYSVTGPPGDTYAPMVLTENDPRLPNQYVADDAMPGSLWLFLVDSTPENWVPSGDFVFTTEVELTGVQADTAQILGLQVAADNALVSIAINTAPVFEQVPDRTAEEFGTPRELGDVGLGLFQPGVNQITIRIRNTGPGFGSGNTGAALRLSGIVDALPNGFVGSADLDNDGDVDGVDLAILFANFNGPGGGVPLTPAADLDGDGDADGVDLAAAFGQFTGPLAPANVPEPGTLALVGLVAAATLQRRHD